MLGPATGSTAEDLRRGRGEGGAQQVWGGAYREQTRCSECCALLRGLLVDTPVTVSALYQQLDSTGNLCLFMPCYGLPLLF